MNLGNGSVQPSFFRSVSQLLYWILTSNISAGSEAVKPCQGTADTKAFLRIDSPFPSCLHSLPSPPPLLRLLPYTLSLPFSLAFLFSSFPLSPYLHFSPFLSCLFSLKYYPPLSPYPPFPFLLPLSIYCFLSPPLFLPFFFSPTFSLLY